MGEKLRKRERRREKWRDGERGRRNRGIERGGGRNGGIERGGGRKRWRNRERGQGAAEGISEREKGGMKASEREIRRGTVKVR